MKTSLYKLYRDDSCLILSDCGCRFRHNSEMSVVFRLGHYMQNLIMKDSIFSGYIVDSEYNRNLGDLKSLKSNKIFRPDIIVHKRGRRDNLLIIEIKTWWNRNFKQDKAKLRNLPSNINYKYRLCLYIGETLERCKLIFILEDSEVSFPLDKEISIDYMGQIKSAWG